MYDHDSVFVIEVGFKVRDTVFRKGDTASWEQLREFYTNDGIAHLVKHRRIRLGSGSSEVEALKDEPLPDLPVEDMEE